MFKKKWIAAALLIAGMSSVAHAGYIETTFSDGLTTPIKGATTFDFDTSIPAGYTGAGWILPASVPGMAAAPAGDSTPFLSVAFPNSSGTETFTAQPGDIYNYLGLYWGSIDNYNWITFYNGNTALGTVTGADVIAAGTSFGDQIAAGSNRYVNFHLYDMWFDRVEFGTSSFAFESDNHAFAQVAEPATVTLVLVAFGALFLLRRRRTAAAHA